MNKNVMYQRLSNIQTSLMMQSISSMELEDLLPLIQRECLHENLMFYFNFIENACVLNLRDITSENRELNIRLYYSTNNDDEISIKKLKEQVLINAFLLTKKGTSLKSSGDASSADIEETPKKEENSKPIQESNSVPPRAIRAAMDTITARGDEITKTALEKELQLNKMSTDNRRQCIAYLRDMEA